MRILLFFILCWSITNVYPQAIAPPLMWQHCYGGSLDDVGYGISATSDGGFIFCGCAGSSDGDILKSSDQLHGGTCDYWGTKIDVDSNIQFKFHYGGTGSDVARKVIETSDGNYIIGGSSQSNDVDITDHHGNNTNPDFWVVKVNATGGVVWKKSYGGTGYDDFGSMILTSDGGYALCGGTSPGQNNQVDGDVTFTFGSSDYWLVKIDASGNIQWQKSYGGSDYEKAFDVKLCSDGGYIMTGFTSSNNGEVSGNHSQDFDGWAVKTDANGNLQWAKCLGGTGQDAFYKVKQLNDGNFLFAGYTFSNDGDISNGYATAFMDDAWLVLLDQNGNLLWSKAYGGDSTDEFSGIQQDQMGGILVSGYSKSKEGDLSLNHGGYDYWFMSVDESGNILWDSIYGGPFDDVCNDLAVANNGRIGMLGYTASDSIDVSGNHGFIYPGLAAKKDYWVVDLGGVVGIHEIPKSTLTVIPSLAHDVVQVSSDDLADENSFITVRNVSGEVVLNEIMNHQSQLLLDISSLHQGIYFIEAKNQKLNAVSKFVKM